MLQSSNDKVQVHHLKCVCIHLVKTLQHRGQRRSWKLFLSFKKPHRHGCVCDRFSPGELASMMNGHPSTLYRPTKSQAYHVFYDQFFCFILLTHSFLNQIQRLWFHVLYCAPYNFSIFMFALIFRWIFESQLC